MMRFSKVFTAFLLLVPVACQDSYESIYVVPPVLNVRKGPSTKQPIVAQVRRGQELRVVEHQDVWVGVLLSDDTAGWVHGNYVGKPAAVRAALKRDLDRKKGTTTRRRPSSTVKRNSSELSIDGLLADLPGEIPTEVLPPLEGLSRVMGAARDGQVVVEFWGDENKLQRAMMMVSVLDTEEADLETNASFALIFVKNALPGLNREQAWMLSRLREISSRDLGSGEIQSKGRVVTFEFLKVLGAVRITVEPTT
jgi:uncharacterized protein YgiM (DUF1202 family)